MKSTVICVLGMHRSGTSCLTGTLEEAGVDLGEVVTSAPFNAKGNRENKQIMALQNDLLIAAGGRWDDPPEQVEWTPEHRARQQTILQNYAGKPLWGFKDPRTLFTLAGWLDVLPDLKLIGIFRHPLETARSLEHRNQIPLERGYQIWARYNQRLLRYHQQFGFPLLSFNAPPDVWQAGVGRFLHSLGLTPPDAGWSFYDPELRHQNAPDQVVLPPHVAQLYDELLGREHRAAA